MVIKSCYELISTVVLVVKTIVMTVILSKSKIKLITLNLLLFEKYMFLYRNIPSVILSSSLAI